MIATPYSRAFHPGELYARRVLLVAQGPWHLNMYAKPTLLYAPVSMEGAVSIMGTVHPFIDDLSLSAAYDGLLQRPAAYRMQTGFLKPFEPEKLRAILRRNWRSGGVSKADLAQAILPRIEFLELSSAINRMNSDLRSAIKG